MQMIINRRMNFSAAWQFKIAAAFLCLIAVSTTGCKKAAPPAAPPAVVQVMQVIGTNAPASTEIIGQLDSPQNVEIRARVEAFVDKMLFIEGSEVKEGDPLFELDNKRLIEEKLAGRERDAGARPKPR